MDNLFLFFLILVLILIIVIYFMVVNINNKNHIPLTTTNTNNNPPNFNNSSSNNSNNYVKKGNEDEIMSNVKGYTNELMYSSDDIKDGDYVSQFKPIDFSKLPKSNNQIGFNPEPKCSYGDIPFANVNVNYLLNNC
jgi:uncharacterized protein YxeA